MSENANSSVPSPSLAIGKWLGLVVSAVVLAEGIWSLLVSLTRSLLLPLMARAIGGDAQGPLGKGDFNFPDLFVSLVELCLAGIVFLSIKIWATRGAPAPRRLRRVAASAQVPVEPPAPAPPRAVVAAPTAPPPEVPVPAPAPGPEWPVPQPVRSEAPAPIPPPKPSPAPVPPPAVTKAKKPEKPKEVYYNIVGEPITPDDE